MAAKRIRPEPVRGSRRSTKRNVGQDSGEFGRHGTVRTALIRGNTFAAKAVQYVEIDGLAIFEGDIVLGTAEEVAQLTEMLRAERASGVASGVAITGAQFRWPNCRIPFTIDAGLPNQARVTAAIAHWEANTNFRFVARTSEADFVTFRLGSGCSSSVGRRGGQQFVNLAAGCDAGRTIHEIGHVVGLWHEQSREDRDLFVSINWAKIQPGMEHNFDQHITDGDDIGAYDFGSIMHYPRDAFSIDGTDTITPIVAVPPGVVVGQRNGLSAGDIAAARSLCAIVKRLKEGPKDPIRETVKELIKDIRLDTLKEQIRDTIKEGIFDPGTTFVENIFPPGQVVVQPGGVGRPLGGVQPFAIVTPSQSPASGGVEALESSISQLDAQLQGLAGQLAQVEAAKQSLQAQFNETSALLAQTIAEHEATQR